MSSNTEENKADDKGGDKMAEKKQGHKMAEKKEGHKMVEKKVEIITMEVLRPCGQYLHKNYTKESIPAHHVALRNIWTEALATIKNDKRKNKSTNWTSEDIAMAKCNSTKATPTFPVPESKFWDLVGTQAEKLTHLVPLPSSINLIPDLKKIPYELKLEIMKQMVPEPKVIELTHRIRDNADGSKSLTLYLNTDPAGKAKFRISYGLHLPLVCKDMQKIYNAALPIELQMGPMSGQVLRIGVKDLIYFESFFKIRKQADMMSRIFKSLAVQNWPAQITQIGFRAWDLDGLLDGKAGYTTGERLAGIFPKLKDVKVLGYENFQNYRDPCYKEYEDADPSRAEPRELADNKATRKFEKQVGQIQDKWAKDTYFAANGKVAPRITFF